MGNAGPTSSNNCKQRVQQIYEESKIQIQRLNPFSKNQEQLPYAEPLEQNIFKGSPQDEMRLNGIIEAEQLKKPAKFNSNDGYEYDQKFWKKQNPNAVIQGHWYRRVPHGLSKFYFPGGKRVFMSYFDHGIPIFDDCLIVFENGAYYHGGLRNFKFHGLGKYVNQDDRVVLQGQWNDGIPVGKAKQTIITDGLTSQFDGYFNSDGQKHGKDCSYTIKSQKNPSQNLFQYKGDFSSDRFSGKSSVKTLNSKQEIEISFNGDMMQINSIETPEFQFQGQFQRNLSHGHGKFRDIKKNSRVIYEGGLHQGMLNGAGSIINEDGSIQKVYWCNGLKLKHLRNFEISQKFNEMIHRIEEAFQRSSAYTQMARILTDQYKQIQNIQTMEGISPKGQHDTYLFEMISKEKANSIAGSSKVGPSSPFKLPKKELIVEMDKGKFLYVTCFKIHPNETAA